MKRVLLGKPLSKKQEQVFTASQAGLSNSEIAQKFNMSRATVRVHLHQSRLKKGIPSSRLGRHTTICEHGHSLSLCKSCRDIRFRANNIKFTIRRHIAVARVELKLLGSK